MHLPAAVVYPLIWLSARIFGGFNLHETSALAGVKASKVPMMIMHGEEDYFVPCEMSKKLHAHSNGMTTLATYPGAGHGLSYMKYTQVYEQSIYDYLASIPAIATSVTFPEVKAK